MRAKRYTCYISCLPVVLYSIMRDRVLNYMQLYVDRVEIELYNFFFIERCKCI